VFAGVGGYYASKRVGLAGVFRCATEGTDWKHALSEVAQQRRQHRPLRAINSTGLITRMSAIGTERKSQLRSSTSAFGGQANVSRPNASAVKGPALCATFAQQLLRLIIT
jgi:hypothetical protein